MGIIHEEEEGAVILGEIAGGYILPVAAVIGEAKRGWTDDPDEALWPAAMLGIGLACGIGSREIGRIDGSEELSEVFGDLGAEAAALFHPLIVRSRAPFRLEGFDGGREGDIAGGSSHANYIFISAEMIIIDLGNRLLLYWQ